MRPFYIHQQIELPKIEMEISHFILHQCSCPKCGKAVKADLPGNAAVGYGPRLSAFVAELSGIKAMSRNDVKQLCESVLGIPIATGTIQKIVDRASNAILPVYEAIGNVARSSECNYIDETSWFLENKLQWLWAMVNDNVAFYRIDPHRSKEAFEKLIQNWEGILVSDSYGLYLQLGSWSSNLPCPSDSQGRRTLRKGKAGIKTLRPNHGRPFTAIGPIFERSAYQKAMVGVLFPPVVCFVALGD